MFMFVQAAELVPRAALCADLAPARPLRIGAAAGPLRAAAGAAAPVTVHANADAMHDDVVVMEEEEWLEPRPESHVQGTQNQVHVTDRPHIDKCKPNIAS